MLVGPSEDKSPKLFGIGTTEDVVQACTLGSLPVRLRSLVSTGAILVAVDSSILAEMLSGPLALLVSSASSSSRTSSLCRGVQGGMQSLGFNRWKPLMGGTQLLKQLEKKLFSMLAFSMSEFLIVCLMHKVCPAYVLVYYLTDYISYSYAQPHPFTCVHVV